MSHAPRVRDLGIVIGDATPGPWNAITDVAGISVGHCTMVDDSIGPDATRTGVTVVLPRPGYVREAPLFAGSATLNGNGEMTGLEWVRESGLLSTPIAITSTHSVGTVRDALVSYDTARAPEGRLFWSLPVVAETYDGTLNDIRNPRIRPDHVAAAIDAATDGPVVEGGVGGGTGMICHQFKGGIGTASRVLDYDDRQFTVGVLVQANHGRRIDLRVDGRPVGRVLDVDRIPAPLTGAAAAALPPGSGSIIILIATDAPLLPDQCVRLARQSYVGLARSGGGCADSSGDIALAFSTGNKAPPEYNDVPRAPFAVSSIPHQAISPLLGAAADATEEAILNAIVAADTMTGRNGVTAHGLEPELLARTYAELAPRDRR